jgi:hypothetical protein
VVGWEASIAASVTSVTSVTSLTLDPIASARTRRRRGQIYELSPLALCRQLAR